MSTYPARTRSSLKSLLLLNRTAQRLNSILDLRQLLETVVGDVALTFNCAHTYILLRECGSNELVMAAVRGEYKAKMDRFRVGIDGMVGYAAAARKPYYAPDVRLNPHYIMCDESIRSELDIPMVAGDDLLGVVSMQREDLDAFSPSDIKILKEMVEHFSGAVRNSYLFEEERSALSHLTNAEQEARLVQQYMFPRSAPDIPGFRVEGDYAPAGPTSGDWFDYIHLPDGKWGVVIADVCGKGMAAALLMSTTRGMLRTLAPHFKSPAELLSRLNVLLQREIPKGKYVTMVYGILDPREGTWTFSNAGHPESLLIEDGQYTWVTNTVGLPLGLMSSEYDERTVRLSPGATLLMYSDGVTEAAGRDHLEFGCCALAAQAEKGKLYPKAVLDEVCRFSGSNLADDATVVVIERL